MLPTDRAFHGAHTWDDDQGEDGVGLQGNGPPFGVIASRVVCACCRGGDGGVKAGCGDGQGAEEVEDLDGGVG